MHHNVVNVVRGIFLWSSTLLDFKIIIHVSFHKPKSDNSIRINKFIYILLQCILCGRHKKPISWKIHLGSNSNNYVVIKQLLIQLIVVHSYINIRPTTWSLAPTNIYKNGLTFIALVRNLKIQIDSNTAIEMHLVKKTTHIGSQLYPILSKLENSHVINFLLIIELLFIYKVIL
jgi:hypothetical protein